MPIQGDIIRALIMLAQGNKRQPVQLSEITSLRTPPFVVPISQSSPGQLPGPVSGIGQEFDIQSSLQRPMATSPGDEMRQIIEQGYSPTSPALRSLLLQRIIAAINGDNRRLF
jgi:hypothetical protein